MLKDQIQQLQCTFVTGYVTKMLRGAMVQRSPF